MLLSLLHIHIILWKCHLEERIYYFQFLYIFLTKLLIFIHQESKKYIILFLITINGTINEMSSNYVSSVVETIIYKYEQYEII